MLNLSVRFFSTNYDWYVHISVNFLLLKLINVNISHILNKKTLLILFGKHIIFFQLSIIYEEFYYNSIFVQFMIRPRRLPKRITFSDSKLKMFRIIFLISIGIVLLMGCLLISLIGKNLTYSSRFTPSSIQSQYLKDSYYNACQILIIMVCTSTIILLIFSIFAAFNQKNMVYFSSSSGLLISNIILCILLLYFLFGSSEYRNYLSQLREKIQQNHVQYCKQSICTVTQCVRVSSYYSARSIVISYLFIHQIAFGFFLTFGYLVNVGRKKAQTLDIII